MKIRLRRALFAGLLALCASQAGAAEIKVLTIGAFREMVLALVPDFEMRTGNKVVVDNDTAGGLQKHIEGGEAFDVAVITPHDAAGLSAAAKNADADVAKTFIKTFSESAAAAMLKSKGMEPAS
jgi:molybdate transport system substrate-binding protein